MILKSPNSRLSLVNLFADFILSNIPKEEDTIIQVVDCINFYVIKGKTTHIEPLNISKLKDEFIVKFENLMGDVKLTHTIDLIEYNCKLSTEKSFTFSFHNTKNCSYNHSQIKSFEKNDTLSYDYQYFLKEVNEDSIFCSEFPHGFSLGQGRLHYYYGKHIFYNIPSSYPVSTSVFTLSTGHSEDSILVKNTSGEVDEVLTSAILDVFDFDMSWLLEDIKKVDWCNEITNPLEDYEFLKKKVKDFIIF
jgi:hypothetical protein